VVEKESTKKENPYTLFLILILLILSNDVLHMLKIKKQNQKTENTDQKKYRILPAMNKETDQGEKTGEKDQEK